MMVTTLAARPFHLLLIAPSAPPKNSAEAMQVGRFLDALDPAVRVTLVTTPIVRGWEWEDASLAIKRPGMQVIVPELPFHKLTRRVLGNHRLAAMHTPDPDFWLPWLVSQVIERLDGVPDVIYSRSAPFSYLSRVLPSCLLRAISFRFCWASGCPILYLQYRLFTLFATHKNKDAWFPRPHDCTFPTMNAFAL